MTLLQAEIDRIRLVLAVLARIARDPRWWP